MTTTSAPKPADTIGAKPATIDRLWRQFRTAIDAAYKGAQSDDPAAALRDYAENVGLIDKLDRLVRTTTQEERQHRSHKPASLPPYRVSAVHCARLLILHAAGDGAARTTAPESTDWLIYRREHCEAELIGWLIRAHVSPEFVSACNALDYAKVVA